MTIGICALGKLSEDTGGRTYIINLSKFLQQSIQDHKVIFFMSYGESGLIKLYKNNFSAIEIRNSGTSYLRVLAEQIILPFMIRKNRIDIMYFPGNFASIYCPSPYVLAIRSMLAYNPELRTAASWSRNFYRRIIIPLSAKRARHILTPSEHTKLEIIQHLRVGADKISVVPHGIDNDIFGNQEKDETAAGAIFNQYGVRRPFILYVSALWDYKNHDKLIRAFKILVTEYGLLHQLVLVGRGMSSYKSCGLNLKTLVQELKIDNKVLFIDFLPHEVLKYFYQHTDVYVFPSEMESFGNSLFEAMAAGAPVVCSNTHGFPSLVKDAALLVNPRNVEQLALSIFLVLSDKELRENLINNGKSLVDSLSWVSTIQKTITHLINNTDRKH